MRAPLNDFDHAALDVDFYVPYSWRQRAHPEFDIENALYAHMKATYPALEIHRQRRCFGGVPDLITVFRFGGYVAITIIEIKAGRAGTQAFNQLKHYMLNAWGTEPETTEIFGVLAAPELSASVPRPEWFAYWPLIIREVAA